MKDKVGDWLKKTVQSGSDKKLVVNPGQKREPAKRKGRRPQGRRPQERRAQERRPHPSRGGRGNALRIIPLGGLEEVGKNSMLFEYGNDIIVVDMGFQFPEEDMLGVDYIIPDMTYLEERKQKIRGILITHGHLDHIGALPYVLPGLGYPPIYGTKLSLGLVKKRLEEFGMLNRVKCKEVTNKKKLQLGAFTVDFFRVNHSIPDAVGMHISSPAGSVVHTGDFKFDFTPLDELPADFSKIASYGEMNITVLVSDSTNALKPGHTISEQRVAATLDRIIKDAEGRVVIASFASLIGRISQILRSAEKHGKKVFLSGRSIENNAAIAKELGFLKFKEDLIKPIKQMKNYQDSQILLLTTGAQGEQMSALARMAMNNHAHVSIKKGDTVVLSSRPIVGNERSVQNVMDNLTRRGADVVNHMIMDTHVSGHGQQEDLKMMMALVKPKYLIPAHGNLHMRSAHAKLGETMKIPEDNNILIDNGDIVEIHNGKLRKLKDKAPSNYVVVDGLGMGDLGSQTIMDREIMAQNGALIVLFTTDKTRRRLLKDPEVITRGFIYMRESEKIVSDITKRAREAFEQYVQKNPGAKRGEIKSHIRRVLDKHTHRELKTQPDQ